MDPDPAPMGFQDLFLAFSRRASRLAFRTPAFASYDAAGRSRRRPRPRKRLLAAKITKLRESAFPRIAPALAD
jgi:hypothetical protein